MEALAYIAAATVALWGVAHVIPTRKVVAGFAPLTTDNRRVLTQEWLAEALAMWGISSLVVVVTAIDGGATMRDWVYRLLAALLIALAALTAATGARTRVIWFKICPVARRVRDPAADIQRRVAAHRTRSRMQDRTTSRPNQALRRGARNLRTCRTDALSAATSRSRPRSSPSCRCGRT